jgi:hypothetical protein
MNRNKMWLVVIFCLALFCTLAIPSAVMADESDQATKLPLASLSRCQAGFFPRVPIGSRSRTTIRIATSFRSGMRTVPAW